MSELEASRAYIEFQGFPLPSGSKRLLSSYHQSSGFTWHPSFSTLH